MQQADIVNIIMGTIKLTAAPEGYEASKNLIQSYQSMIGGLMWPAT